MSGQLRQVVERALGHLYPQLLVSAGLVAATGLVTLFPVGPLARIKEALVWTATHDYDFSGQVRAAGLWAEQRGGWGKAAADLWRNGADRLRKRLGPLAQPLRPAAGDSSFIMPVEGAVLYGFGWLPPEVGDQIHEGIDLLVPVGTPVVAVADGRVVRVASDERLGRMVEIEHGRLLVRYAQVDRVEVVAGQRVRRGSRIAVVGPPAGAERAYEPHLHLEVRPVANGLPVDPAPHLPVRGKEL